MKPSFIYFFICLFLFIGTSAIGQEDQTQKNDTLIQLVREKDRVILEEKEALRKKVEEINLQLENKEISKEEAGDLKKQAAEKHALNIENRTAIIDNQIALLERNDEEDLKIRGSRFELRIFDNDEKADIKEIKYDKRTKMGMVLTAGFNNVITEGESFDDTDFEIGGSRFFEIGLGWTTRVLDNSNWVRFKYGFAFQFNGLKPTKNRYFIEEGNQTVLEKFPVALNKSKFRMDNLVIPLHFEFGPSKKVEHTNYLRYSTSKKFRFGVGGYGGLNLGSRQKLKYKEEGSRQKDKLKGYETSKLIYGVSGYVGWGSLSVYMKYDLNPIFKNNDIRQNNISLGIRLD